MPFTPFHFGPSSCGALLLRKYIDFPVFVLANVIVDVEPLLVMVFNFNYPLHGYCHTLFFGSLFGILVTPFFYLVRGGLKKAMTYLRLPYETNYRKVMISVILGIWLHVLLDAFLYPDIRPFFPLADNPLYGKLGYSKVYAMCAIFFVPAFILYRRIRLKTED